MARFTFKKYAKDGVTNYSAVRNECVDNHKTKKYGVQIGEHIDRLAELEDKLEQGTLIEKTMEPTELQSLIALAIEIGNTTDHYISFHLSKSKTVDLFDVTVYDKTLEKTDFIAECQHLTIENIEKCRAELLKYKEGKHGN